VTGRAAWLASLGVLLAVVLGGCRPPSPVDSSTAVRTDSRQAAAPGPAGTVASTPSTATAPLQKTAVRGRRNLLAGRSFGDDGAAMLNRIEIKQ